MHRVIVTVQRFGQSETHELEVSAELPAVNLAEAIGERLAWDQAPSGDRIVFQVEVFPPGRRLAIHESLAEVGAWDGAWLVLHPVSIEQRPRPPAVPSAPAGYAAASYSPAAPASPAGKPFPGAAGPRQSPPSPARPIDPWPAERPEPPHIPNPAPSPAPSPGSYPHVSVPSWSAPSAASPDPAPSPHLGWLGTREPTQGPAHRTSPGSGSPQPTGSPQPSATPRANQEQPPVAPNASGSPLKGFRPWGARPNTQSARPPTAPNRPPADLPLDVTELPDDGETQP